MRVYALLLEFTFLVIFFGGVLLFLSGTLSGVFIPFLRFLLLFQQKPLKRLQLESFLGTRVHTCLHMCARDFCVQNTRRVFLRANFFVAKTRRVFLVRKCTFVFADRCVDTRGSQKTFLSCVHDKEKIGKKEKNIKKREFLFYFFLF